MAKDGKTTEHIGNVRVVVESRTTWLGNPSHNILTVNEDTGATASLSNVSDSAWGVDKAVTKVR